MKVFDLIERCEGRIGRYSLSASRAGKKIDLSNLSKGVTLSLTNARTFLNEATLLIEDRYLRHSVGLIELTIEEIGKAQHIQDAMGEATILRKQVIHINPAMFRKHRAKLEASPRPGLTRHTKRERRLHASLVRFLSSGSVLRQRSFYVDFRRTWQWGNPRLERQSVLWYVINELGVTIDYVKDMAAILQKTNRLIEVRRFHDKRVQELINEDPYLKDLYDSECEGLSR